MTAYYNEIDPYAAQWLRNLIAAGHIAPGDVDERSIEDVKPADLAGYTQCHFFAGIGVWSHALRRAGWSDSRPVWTGSCPCQPFSTAGKGNGFADQRHLWPAWFHLITQCRPDRIYGEQVASADGLAWLDLVQADLEAAGYARGAVDLCAAGIGAPHIRQRLWFVADSHDPRLEGWRGMPERTIECAIGAGGVVSGLLANGAFRLADAERQQYQRGISGHQEEFGQNGSGAASESTGRCSTDDPGPTNGFWRNADWLLCRDRKWRPVEPGTFPLANGAAARVGRLRAYGNAINAEVAEMIILATM